MTSTTVIARPVSDVFRYLLDFENMPEWATDVGSCRKTSDGPVGPGTTFSVGQLRMGREYHSDVRIVDVDADRSIKADGEVGPLSLKLTFDVTPAENGTQVTVHGDGELRGILKVLSPIGARQGRRIWDARLSSLKRVLEG